MNIHASQNRFSPTLLKPLRWKWCAACQRCYQRPESTIIKPDLMCPYEDCAGLAMVCEWDWSTIRRYDPAFPETPYLYCYYSVYV